MAVAAATVAATEPVMEPASSTESGSARVDGRGKTETFERAVFNDQREGRIAAGLDQPDKRS